MNNPRTLLTCLVGFGLLIGPGAYAQDDLFGGFDMGGGDAAPTAPAAEGGGLDLGLSGGEDDVMEGIPDLETVTDEQRAEEAKKLAEQRRVIHEERKMRARKHIEKAFDAMEQGKWQIAVDQVEQAQALFEVVKQLEEEIEIARQLKSNAYYNLAEGVYDRRDEGARMAQAREFLRLSQESWEANPKIAELEVKIAKYEDDLDKGKIRQPIEEEDKYKTIASETRRLLARGRKEMEIGDYDQAEKTFEEILRFDRYNIDALRFLERVTEKRWESHKVERELSVTKMMREAEEAWLYPLDVDKQGKDEEFTPVAGNEIAKAEEAMISKLQNIPVRQINFRRAHISDVIEELVRISREMDPDGEGVNIIFMDPELADSGVDDGGGAGDAAPAPAADPFGGLGGGFGGPALGGGGATAAPSRIPPITLELRNVNLLDALETVTEIADLYYRFDGNVIIIQRKGEGELITRFYPVDPARWTLVSASFPGGGGGAGGAGGGDPFGGDPFGGPAGGGSISDGPDIEALFERYGVTIPDKGGIAYESLIAQLVVTLTPDQFPQFEQVLAKINVAPTQVQIEARFVEVNQSDLEQLGFEWILTDDAEILVQDGPGPVAARPRIIADQNPSGVTGGLRFFDFDPVANNTSPTARSSQGNNFLGDILSLRGVLTNPEVQFILHAIEQNGNSDLLSAPRVTTLNGVNAIIEVVEEIIYPTEFDVTENDIEIQGGGGEDNDQPVFVPPTVIPGGFETREVGVILNVTPTVSADNYTINLVMLPEIAELVDWIQYGTQVPIGDQVFIVNMPQPVFASRNITTSMIVWDGHTVVMGGLIRESLTTFEDKVPILGDIPILGRLFRSEGTSSQKRNLLIFVTARLVDPSGTNVNQGNRQDLVAE